MKNLSIKNLEVIDNEPRIKDVILGERLGLAQARNIKQVIDANSAELGQYGRLHVERASVKAGFFNKETTSYYLNEAQALLLCMFSRTEKAAQVRKELIDIYMAYRTKGLTKVNEHYRKISSNKEKRRNREDMGEVVDSVMKKFFEIKTARESLKIRTMELFSDDLFEAESIEIYELEKFIAKVGSELLGRYDNQTVMRFNKFMKGIYNLFIRYRTINSEARFGLYCFKSSPSVQNFAGLEELFKDISKEKISLI